jgi:hypothetical protein
LGVNNCPFILFLLCFLSILSLNFNEKSAKSQKIPSVEEAIYKSLLRRAQNQKMNPITSSSFTILKFIQLKQFCTL